MDESTSPSGITAGGSSQAVSTGTRRLNELRFTSRSALPARFVVPREPFAEVHSSHQVRFDNLIGAVADTVLIGFLQLSTIRIGKPDMRDAKLQMIGYPLQHVAWPVVRRRDLN